ncbi:MAG: ribose 5-phosphate isomerase A [Archaeoglobaceae archaeon]|nr:ribose 5-phosphate isomerase A [Archaeoglobaceae archaeon]MDW7989274.1 ribose 5-phosphate isomerase A [Archaeoglobaceae archaeon]
MNGKINASKLALELIKDGITLGIGSGTTVEIFLNLLGEKIRKEGLTVYGIPSSYQAMMTAIKNGIKTVDFAEKEPDICIDGADQVDAELNCIKGAGGAMMREKIVAFASRRVIIIVDESKLSEKLTAKVPVEILPFAYGYVFRKLSDICKPKLREGNGKVGPVITDNGNFILDCDFGTIESPEEVERRIKSIPGVLETGIFPSKVISAIIVGSHKCARMIENIHK